MYENMLEKYRKELDKNYYVLWVSVGVSIVMGGFLVCLGVVRRKEFNDARKIWG